MKKILFVAPLMAISLLASCGNNNPQKDEYTVTEQEMKDAYDMKGVDYLQYNRTTEGVVGYEKCEFTPISYYHLNEWSEIYNYNETLVLKDGDNYSKYYRESKGEPFTPDTYKEGDFRTISKFANDMFGELKDKGYDDFYYNEKRKEYMNYVTYPTGDVVAAIVQFYNKKIIKLTTIYEEASEAIKDNFLFTYDKIEPPSPTI